MKKGCDKISHLVSDAFERKLSWLERIEVKIHLSMCQLCSSYARNMTMLHDVCSYIRRSDMDDNSQLPKASKQKIKYALQQSQKQEK